MERSSSHIRQWKHNREFVEQISPAFSDWIITAIFYGALHAIDALLSKNKIVVTSHSTRNAILIQTNKYTHINKAYQPLYALSQTVRYLADPSKWVPVDKIESNVCPYLYQIEGSVQKLMGIDLKLEKIRLGSKIGGLTDPSAEPPTVLLP